MNIAKCQRYPSFEEGVGGFEEKHKRRPSAKVLGPLVEAGTVVAKSGGCHRILDPFEEWSVGPPVFSVILVWAAFLPTVTCSASAGVAQLLIPPALASTANGASQLIGRLRSGTGEALEGRMMMESLRLVELLLSTHSTNPLFARG